LFGFQKKILNEIEHLFLKGIRQFLRVQMDFFVKCHNIHSVIQTFIKTYGFILPCQGTKNVKHSVHALDTFTSTLPTLFPGSTTVPHSILFSSERLVAIAAALPAG
jgi:hypothetical protein